MSAVPDRHPDLLIAAEGVTVRRGARTVLDRVDLAIHAGEIVSLLGPNGGGKSTLVKVMLGLIRPGAGIVTRRPDLTVGYVPQKLAVDPNLPLTVRRFMTLTGPAPVTEIEETLAETGVAHLIGRMLDGLSGGEMQRVALARALLARPQWLVLDEPVQGVDFTGEAELYDLIGEIRDRHGCGILLVSHDLHVVMAATDHVVCLNGHVCCAGAPDAVTLDPEYRRLFGPRAGLAHYSHHHDHRHGTGGGGEAVDEHRPEEPRGGHDWHVRDEEPSTPQQRPRLPALPRPGSGRESDDVR